MSSSSGLCQYADVFGAPGTGAHAWRIGGLAAVDLLATVAAALISRYALGRRTVQAFLVVLVILLLAGIFMHKAFCVNTKLNSILFDEPYVGAQPTSQQK